MTVEAVTSEQNLKGFRRLYDEVESYMRILRALGVASESYGALLSSVLLKKLPPELCLIVSRKVSDSELDMDSLLKIVEEKLIARQRTLNPISASLRRPQDKSRSTAATLFSGTRPHTACPTCPTCCYCQQPPSFIDRLQLSA